MANIITDKEIEDMHVSGFQGKKSVKLSGHGKGSLLIRFEKNRVDLYFSWTEQKKKRTRKLGQHRASEKDGGITVEQARKKAVSLSDVKLEGHNISLYQKKSIDRLGTFLELIIDYTSSLEGRSCYQDVKNLFGIHLIQVDSFRTILNKPANTCSSEDFIPVLQRMRQKGIGRRCNMMRSYLQAAFNWAKKSKTHWYALDEEQSTKYQQKYGITYNPIENIPVARRLNNSGKEQLSDRMLWILWHKGPEVMGVAGQLAKLIIAIGGARQEHLMRLQQKEYIKRNAYPHLILHSLKGTDGEVSAVEYTLPVSDLTRSVLSDLSTEFIGCKYFFPARHGGVIEQNSRMSRHMSSAINRMKKYCQLIDPEFAPKNFSMGMLRTSISTRMHEAGVPDKIVDRLMFNQIQGIRDKSYDKWEYKREKMNAAKKWENYLYQTIINKQLKDVPYRFPEEDA